MPYQATSLESLCRINAQLALALTKSIRILMGLLSAQQSASSVDGIRGLANRLFNGQGDRFEFVLTGDNEPLSRTNPPKNDSYTVSGSDSGKILVEGTTLSALARGLRHYATEVLQLDEYWFVDTFKQPPDVLPNPAKPLTGSSVVPWRYNLNTVTFSYTFVWYQWRDWEKLLDWAAWRGINLQLAWVGYEKIFLDSFRELGMTDEEIMPFFSGPAFQAWNRFGNIQGSWGDVGDLTMDWIDGQFALQKKIVARMVELGITPVLPAFPGYVPKSITRVRPNANITQAPEWPGVPGVGEESSKVTFLSPLDETSAELQKLFLKKQEEAYGNITSFYTLDQFNEVSPASGEPQYLSDVSKATYKALTDANPSAVWLLQGWLFFNEMHYWTQERIDAYLGGVEDKNGMLILDLYSDNEPQWQRTQSYAGRPWIWCQLHDFGGNMALFGQATTVTVDALKALEESPSLVGFGLTPEGYEGNEVVYDLLLDQAWSVTPINKSQYFRDWATRRYASDHALPDSLYEAWDLLGKEVYDNLDHEIPCAGVSIYEIVPALSGLINRIDHYPPPTKLQYDPAILKKIWALFIRAAIETPKLYHIPAFRLDLVDMTRQVLGNSFIDMYQDLVDAFNKAIAQPKSESSSGDIAAKGNKLVAFLEFIDFLISSEKHFTLEQWLEQAKAWATPDAASQKLFAFNARSQVTVWNWAAESLNDYASKGWGGLIRSYYVPRWKIFVDRLIKAIDEGKLNEIALHDEIRSFEKQWQDGGFEIEGSEGFHAARLEDIAAIAVDQWPEVFPKV